MRTDPSFLPLHFSDTVRFTPKRLSQSSTDIFVWLAMVSSICSGSVLLAPHAVSGPAMHAIPLQSLPLVLNVKLLEPGAIASNKLSWTL